MSGNILLLHPPPPLLLRLSFTTLHLSFSTSSFPSSLSQSINLFLCHQCDQVGEGFINSPTQLNNYCRDKGFVTWLKTSAKENIGLEEAGKALISKVQLHSKWHC